MRRFLRNADLCFSIFAFIVAVYFLLFRHLHSSMHTIACIGFLRPLPIALIAPKWRSKPPKKIIRVCLARIAEDTNLVCGLAPAFHIRQQAAFFVSDIQPSLRNSGWYH